MGLSLTLVAWLQVALARAVYAHPAALYPALKSFLAKAAGWQERCVGAESCSMAQHLLPLHTPYCPREQGGSCEGPLSDLSPRACWPHIVAQRRLCEGQSARGPEWGQLIPGWFCHPGPPVRGHQPCSTPPLGRVRCKEGCVWGMGRGQDGDTNCATTTTRRVAQTKWLQRSLLVLKQGEKKAFLGPELQNLVT